MSTGTGKRPAATRGQTRYSRRDSSSERSPPRAAAPPTPRTPAAGSPRTLTPVGPRSPAPVSRAAAPVPPPLPTPAAWGPASPGVGRAVVGDPKQPAKVNRRKPTQQELPMLDARQAPPDPSGRHAGEVARRGTGKFRSSAEEESDSAGGSGSGSEAHGSAKGNFRLRKGTGNVPLVEGPAARSSAGNRATSPESATPAAPRRRRFTWKRPNRRISFESRSPALWVAEQLAALARRLLFVVKMLGALAVLVAAVLAGRLAVQHVVASPRFALQEVRVAPTTHVHRDEIVALSTVELGDRLLALDTDVIAARLARHPWISAARVRRQLPSTLVIEVTERRAAAVAVIGGLYLLDEKGHPFKHATLQEADGQVVLTGISRGEYAALPGASEAAFREALSLLAAYQNPDSLAAARHGSSGGARPALSEIHIDPRTGFSLYLYDGGTEIRLGRGGLPDKLARLDEILAEFGPRGVATLRVVHLDGPAGDRVPIRLALPTAPVDETGSAGASTAGERNRRSQGPSAGAAPKRGRPSKKIDVF